MCVRNNVFLTFRLWNPRIFWQLWWNYRWMQHVCWNHVVFSTFRQLWWNDTAPAGMMEPHVFLSYYGGTTGGQIWIWINKQKLLNLNMCVGSTFFCLLIKWKNWGQCVWTMVFSDWSPRSSQNLQVAMVEPHGLLATTAEPQVSLDLDRETKSDQIEKIWVWTYVGNKFFPAFFLTFRWLQWNHRIFWQLWWMPHVCWNHVVFFDLQAAMMEPHGLLQLWWHHRWTNLNLNIRGRILFADQEREKIISIMCAGSTFFCPPIKWKKTWGETCAFEQRFFRFITT